MRRLGPWVTQASCPTPCLPLELNLGGAQSLTPWSICPACRGPAPETQALPLIVVSATWDVVCGTGAQGHAKHMSVIPLDFPGIVPSLGLARHKVPWRQEIGVQRMGRGWPGMGLGGR